MASHAERKARHEQRRRDHKRRILQAKIKRARDERAASNKVIKVVPSGFNLEGFQEQKVVKSGTSASNGVTGQNMTGKAGFDLNRFKPTTSISPITSTV